MFQGFMFQGLASLSSLLAAGKALPGSEFQDFRISGFHNLIKHNAFKEYVSERRITFEYLNIRTIERLNI